MAGWRQSQVGDLAVWALGHGPKHALLLHGGPGLSDYTGSLGELLAPALGDGWTLVRFQQRGLSPSTPEGPFTLEQAVADVVAVADAMTAQAVALVGHSWGGHLALHAAVAAPARFDRLVPVDPLGAVPDGGRTALRDHMASHLTAEEVTAFAAAAAQPSPDLAERDQLRVIWRYYFADPASAPPMPPIEVSSAANEGLFADLTAHFERGTLVDGLGAVTVPTLFVAGAHGPIPSTESEKSAALMPNARTVVLPTGHFPWLESPTETVAAITSFLTE